MRHGCWLACMSLLVVLVNAFSAHVQSIPESEVMNIPERLRELLLVRRLISSLNAAEAVPEVQARPPQGIRKRTCYINAGLSQGCDYKDLVGAMAEKNYWDSLNSPGRRRRAVDSTYPSSSSSSFPSLPSIPTSKSSSPSLSSPSIFPSSRSSSLSPSPSSFSSSGRNNNLHIPIQTLRRLTQH